MARPRALRRRAATLAAVATAVVAGASPAVAADGGQVWTSAGCGTCHTLNVTGSRTRIGPNLDELAPTADEVAAQVRNGGSSMPSFAAKLTAEQISAVAGFVAANAGRLPGSKPIVGTITPTVTGPLPPAAPWVVSLQKKLASLGFFSGPQTGVYGPLTTAAVVAFQTKAGLTPDGKWGPLSQAALVRSIAAGKVVTARAATAKGTTTTATTTTPAATSTTPLPAAQPWVKSLQQKLAQLGFFSGAATGVYGPLTTAAVKSFQANAGLTVDGMWGPASQAALTRAIAAGG